MNEKPKKFENRSAVSLRRWPEMKLKRIDAVSYAACPRKVAEINDSIAILVGETPGFMTSFYWVGFFISTEGYRSRVT